jgi:hypothetical protein
VPEPDVSSNEEVAGSGGVFISHIHEDREIAEAFADLVRDVTAGAVKTYASSSTAPHEGIRYGDEWYQWIRDRVEQADHVVALLTPRSVGKPWILFEAGLGKAQSSSSMFGLAVGMSVAAASVGPFGVFQNSSADKDSLIKLCAQLTASTQLRPREQVVGGMVDLFIQTVEGIVPHEESVVEDPKSAALFQAIEDLKFQIRESRPHDRGEATERDVRRKWRTALNLLEQDMLPSRARRRLLVAAATELIDPVVGVLAEDFFAALPASHSIMQRSLGSLDQAVSMARMNSSNDWVFHFIRREMQTGYEHSVEARERRKRQQEAAKLAAIEQQDAPADANGD